MRRPRRSGLRPLEAALAAILATIPIFLNGLDSFVGQTAIAIGGCATAAALLLRVELSWRFWRSILPILLLLAAGAIWASLPLWFAPAARLAPPLAPDIAIVPLMAGAGYAAAFLVGAILGRRPALVSAAVAALLSAGMVNLLSALLVRNVLDTAGWELWRVGSDERFAGTLGNPNVAGAYYGALSVLALSSMARAPAGEAPDRALLRRLASGGAALLMVGACGLTASRSAVLCTTAALLLVLAASWHGGGGKRSRVGLVLISLGAAGLMAAGIFDVFADRAVSLAGVPTGRLRIWHHFGALVPPSPWFGYGPGSFPALKTASLTDPSIANEMWRVNAAHNVVLQLLLDGGAGLLLAVLGAGALMLSGLVRSIRAHRDGSHALGIAAALGIVLGCAQVDIVLAVPATILLAMFLAGLGWSAQRPARMSASPARI